MPDPSRRCVVLTGYPADDTGEAVARLGELGPRLGLSLFVPADEAAKHGGATYLGYQVVGEPAVREADLCLVFGGDGTILRALGRLVGSGVPTLGVNFGNVGFLAALPRVDWETGLQAMLGGDARAVELLTVEVDAAGERYTAVNDVVLSRIAPRHVLQLQYEVAGVTVGTMFCDGLVVASPAGSSAYNLSCGGPIVEWDADVLVLNFIAPHSLGFRPVILRSDHAITARNVSRLQEAEIVVDGDSRGRLHCGDEVRIVAGAERARLLTRGEASFYRNVEEKLFECRDAR